MMTEDFVSNVYDLIKHNSGKLTAKDIDMTLKAKPQDVRQALTRLTVRGWIRRRKIFRGATIVYSYVDIQLLYNRAQAVN